MFAAPVSAPDGDDADDGGCYRVTKPRAMRRELTRKGVRGIRYQHASFTDGTVAYDHRCDKKEPE